MGSQEGVTATETSRWFCGFLWAFFPPEPTAEVNYKAAAGGYPQGSTPNHHQMGPFGIPMNGASNTWWSVQNHYQGKPPEGPGFVLPRTPRELGLLGLDTTSSPKAPR